MDIILSINTPHFDTYVYLTSSKFIIVLSYNATTIQTDIKLRNDFCFTPCITQVYLKYPLEKTVQFLNKKIFYNILRIVQSIPMCFYLKKKERE